MGYQKPLRAGRKCLLQPSQVSHPYPKGRQHDARLKLLLSPALYCLPGAPFSWVTRVPPRSNTT